MAAADFFDPNGRTLLSSAFLISGDHETHLRAGEMLDLFGLPDPAEGEFTQGDHADLVHLTGYGITLRLAYRRHNIILDKLSELMGRQQPASPVFDARKAEHARVLQPLEQIDLTPNCTFEILPTVAKVGVKEQVARTLARALQRDGISFYEPDGQYVGLLRDPKTGRTQNVVVNRSAIKATKDLEGSEQATPGDLQKKVFRGLREELMDVFAGASGARAEKFLKHCASIVALPRAHPERILHPSWLDLSYHTERRAAIARHAAAYQQHLRMER